MRSSRFIFFCLLLTVFYLLPTESSHSPSPQLSASKRRPARKYLSTTSFSSPESHEYYKTKVHKEELFYRPSLEEIFSNAVENEASNDDMGEPVYHTDYHGVTTHPNPTPKHPSP